LEHQQKYDQGLIIQDQDHDQLKVKTQLLRDQDRVLKNNSSKRAAITFIRQGLSIMII